MRRDHLPVVQRAVGDRFALERELGRGGAARVFLASDREGRRVALKVLHPELRASVMADRFLREIRLVGRLEHPLILPILESGEADSVVYFTMPYVEGLTLRETLDRQGPLSIPAARQLATDLLGALACAHAQAVVHRDVKPENVVMSRSGAVLLDFGIARAVLAAGGDQLTQAGIAVGTSAYMSPEQANAEPDLDQRSDLYALGCLLFECLAGRPPFSHRNEQVVLQMQLNEPAPDVRIQRPDTPNALAEAIARALRKPRTDRWQTAAEMAGAVAA